MYIQKYLQIVHFTLEKNSFNTCCMHRVTSFTCAIHCKCETPAYQPYFDNVYIFHDDKTDLTLKLVSAIFYQIFIFSPNYSLSKTMESFFISSKKLFSFSRCSNFCISIFFSFSPCQPLL